MTASLALAAEQIEAFDAILAAAGASLTVSQPHTDDPTTGGDAMDAEVTVESAGDLRTLIDSPDQFWADRNGIAIRRCRMWKG